MPYLIFNNGSLSKNEDAFHDINGRINHELGYPNKMGTLTYSNPIYHPDGEQIAINIMHGINSYLTEDQIKSLIEELPKDWNKE